MILVMPSGAPTKGASSRALLLGVTSLCYCAIANVIINVGARYCNLPLIIIATAALFCGRRLPAVRARCQPRRAVLPRCGAARAVVMRADFEF